MEIENIGSGFKKVPFTADFLKILTSQASMDEIQQLYHWDLQAQFVPICAKTGVPLKLPVRSTTCTKSCITCVYEYDPQITQKDKFACKRDPNKCSTIDQLCFDFRLVNFLTDVRERYSDIGDFEKTLIKVNKFGDLQMSAGNLVISERRNTAAGGLIGVDGAEDAKMEIRSAIQRRTYDYLSTKNQLGELGDDWGQECGQIITRISGQDKNRSLIKEINKEAAGRRPLKQGVKYLFGFCEGKIYCCPPLGIVSEFETVLPIDKGNLKESDLNGLNKYYGGSWFFAVNNNNASIYAVGGSSATGESVVEKNIMQFILNTEDKKAIWKPQLLGENRKELGIYHAGSIFMPKNNNFPKGCAFILGGIYRKSNALGMANRNIFCYDLDKTLTQCGSLITPRINQSYTYNKNKIYISGGLKLEKWDEEIPLTHSFKQLREKGGYMYLMLEIFNCDNKHVQYHEITVDQNKINYFAHRCLSTVLSTVSSSGDSKQSQLLVIFGGVTSFGTGEHAMAVNLTSLPDKQSKERAVLKTFGNNVFEGQITVGNDSVISEVNTVVDFEGIRTENFSEWLYVSREGPALKIREFALTSQESELGFRWRF